MYTPDPLTEERVKEIIQDYLKSGAFVIPKITDTPLDSLQTVNRKFVTANGTTRPTNPITGQFYFDTSLGAHGKPVWRSADANWVDGSGAVV